MTERRLIQVPANPNASQFALDSSRHVILGTNPGGHLVEVTTRTSWEVTAADNVTIKRFTFRHAATASQGHAIGNDDHANYLLTESTLSDAHGTMLSTGGGDLHSTVTDNTLTRAGDLAFGSYNSGHPLIRGNTITSSGFGGWDWSWQVGGIKTVFSHSLTVDGNSVYGNGGQGLWYDADGLLMACR